MRFSLRALVGLTVVGPPLLAGLWLWHHDILVVLAMLAIVLLAMAVVFLFLAIPFAIPFALAGLFWLITKRGTKRLLGVTVAEWLVLVLIAVCVVGLCLPHDPSYGHSRW